MPGEGDRAEGEGGRREGESGAQRAVAEAGPGEGGVLRERRQRLWPVTDETAAEIVKGWNEENPAL
ncbi:hypothetical protein ABZ619_15435 [Streptomyces sp. NPDC007851]|uniref:hypothetical protein n=1 Tax=Streptomyces sp. NPDC007851 TaxID=3155008 RepID=UPI0033E201EC